MFFNRSVKEPNEVEREYLSTQSRTITNSIVIQSIIDYAIIKGLIPITDEQFKEKESYYFENFNKDRDLYLDISILTRGSFNSPAIKINFMEIGRHCFIDDYSYLSYNFNINPKIKYVKINSIFHSDVFAELTDVDFYKKYKEEFGELLSEERKISLINRNKAIKED